MQPVPGLGHGGAVPGGLRGGGHGCARPGCGVTKREVPAVAGGRPLVPGWRAGTGSAAPGHCVTGPGSARAGPRAGKPAASGHTGIEDRRVAVAPVPGSDQPHDDFADLRSGGGSGRLSSFIPSEADSEQGIGLLHTGCEDGTNLLPPDHGVSASLLSTLKLAPEGTRFMKLSSMTPAGSLVRGRGSRSVRPWQRTARRPHRA